VLSVLLRYTDSDYPFGIFKLFLLRPFTQSKTAMIRLCREASYCKLSLTTNYLGVSVLNTFFERDTIAPSTCIKTHDDVGHIALSALDGFTASGYTFGIF
jgi:hypothetical protein